MEGLHAAISDSVRNGLIHGIQIGSSDVNLSHLFFADDVIITSEWSNHDVHTIIRIFNVFFLAFGLKINIRKSSIYGVGVSSEEVHHMASLTRCNAGSFPLTYLGLPIGSNMYQTTNWKSLVDKFHSKLSLWKANLLSFGGRLMLHKSILGSLGIYFFSLFKVPSTVVNSLESLRASFFWGDLIFEKAILAEMVSLKAASTKMGVSSMVFGLRLSGLLITYILSPFSLRTLLDFSWSRNDLETRNSSYLNQLLTEISHIEVRESLEKCVWSLAQDEMFIVGLLRRTIDDHSLPSLGVKTHWVKSLPRKVNIFMWRLKLDRLRIASISLLEALIFQ
ncbi:reverse transcriptase domain, reverse transcriptase zinc-binding domain protein [Tanacetum coccineum]